MESAAVSAFSDDREEGEIVDDDFEDISDNSIIVPILYSGKSVSSKEHLPAISLSSVTEVDEPKTEEKIRHRQKTRRKNSTKKSQKTYRKRRNTHRRSATYSDSDSDDLELDKKLQIQLKAAIRVDDIEERHKNSLRSRLRAMTKLDNDSDISVEKNDIRSEKVEQKESSDEGDTELTQLRLEALRTAVLNKFMHRKKRKMKEIQDNDVMSDISIKTDTSETNKENNHNANDNNVQVVEESSPKRICVEKPVENIENKIEIADNIVIENNTPPEDDEDVLRALLLASMSKKITTEPESKITNVPTAIRSNLKLTWTSKTAKNEVKNVSLKNVAQFRNRVIKNNVKNQPVHLPQVKPLIINVNGDSDTDDDLFRTQINAPNGGNGLKPLDVGIESTVEKFLKEQRAKVEAQSVINAPSKPTNSVILEKSSVKLLPKVKQIEYQKLLQRLKNAEKRPRVRRLSTRYTGDAKAIGITPKKIVRTKVLVNKQGNIAQKQEQSQDIRNEARTLHKTMKEMQVHINGSINEASIERKKCDEDVKRLLEELTEAKKKLLRCQQSFLAHVRELIEGKEEIDKSLRNPKPTEQPKTRFTSTPIKGQAASLESFEASSVPTSTPDQTPKIISRNVEGSAPDPPATVRVEDDVVETPLNPGDPNDIDKIYSKQKSSMPKYISPLDNVKRAAADDPFLIVCPYDVDGNCRDQECVYKHLFK